MADFSSSGIYGLPTATVDTLTMGVEGVGDPRVHGWLIEAVQDGDRFNQADPGYELIGRAQAYLDGDQTFDPREAKLPWLPRLVVNEMREAAQMHVSALTDVRPVFAFKSPEQYQLHAHLLNKIVVWWWVTTMADLALGDTIKYALCGTGDLKVEWDPHVAGGATVLIPSDPRDTLPIRPSLQRSPQLWQGVTFREEHSVNVLRGTYPSKRHLFVPNTDTLLSRIAGQFRTVMARIISPAADTLSGLSPGPHTARPRSGGVTLFKTYLADYTRNLTNRPIAMGEPGSAWAYVAKPGDLLYPNKRLIIWSEKGIVSDGPSPFMHGLFPVCRLSLWSVPWRFYGLGLFHDVMPIQDAINDSGRDILLAIKQWLSRTTKYDRNAVSETFMRSFDPRKPGGQVKLAQGFDKGFEMLDGPNPQMIALAVEFWKELRGTMKELTSTANLQALLSLRQMPSGDTLDRYYEAMTPELRNEARMIEVFLRDLAEMVKANIFQYMPDRRRLEIAGDPAGMLDALDYDPGELLPSMSPGDQGYDEGLDKSLPWAERARNFHKLFVFQVAPGSLLAMHAQEEKMLDLQLARMGYLDFWSLMERLERPNVGTPPAIPLPPLNPIDPAEVIGLAQSAPDPAMALQTLATKYTMDPMTGQLLEIRVPQTITERLMAQQLLGIGMTQNPAGRKASGQQAPQVEEKTDQTGAPRQTVTESKK